MRIRIGILLLSVFGLGNKFSSCTMLPGNKNYFYQKNLCFEIIISSVQEGTHRGASLSLSFVVANRHLYLYSGMFGAVSKLHRYRVHLCINTFIEVLSACLEKSNTK
jgi:hypothetical protein